MLDMRNQFIFSPVKTGYSDDSGQVSDRHIEFYRLRSRHVGAVALEPLYMEKGLREIPTQMGIDSDDKIAGLKKLTSAIHSEGAKVIAHLNHPGRMVNPKLPGNYYLSSTDKACENGGQPPKKMDRSDMDQVIRQFSDAAGRAESAGFDSLELQLGHGYLLAQFISPAVNDRDDEYGGSFENRIRFPMEVVRAVKQTTSLPIIIRISGDEMIPNGIHPDEMVLLGEKLAAEGIKLLHVSAGTICSTPPWFFQHMFIPKGKTWELAAKIKGELKAKGVEMGVIFVGRVNSREDVDTLLNKYNADYVAVGRGLVADHDFFGKYLGKIEGEIRPCLACAEGCLGGVKSGEGLHCVVNPLAGHETEEEFKAASASENEGKHYAVIGGGLAGMESALTLREKGHKVDLYEKEALGGQFNLAYLPPKKDSLKEIVDYYSKELEREGVNVIMEAADPDALKKNGYAAVVLATGAEPFVPPIKGLSEYSWAELLHSENRPTKQKILVIGGGLIGMEMASSLVENENEVIIVEMLPAVANGMEMIEKAMTMKKLADKDVTIYTNYKVQEVDGSTVKILGDEEVQLEDIDRIVVAAGMKSSNALKEDLEASLPVYTIGDAEKVGKAQTAIKSARLTALKL